MLICAYNAAPIVGDITAPVDPIQVGTEIAAIADFTDPDTLDTHTAEWDWGDSSTSPGTVDEANESVGGSHTYTAAGVYTVTLTVTDDDGDSDQSVFQYVVIYDPDGGFVTGGGWIDSPAGAYTADPELTGKANFGFVSKYKKGTDIPTGNTQFSFRVADLKFHSTEYQWLVVAGPHAKFKGDGTINNDGNYGFMVTATDGELNGGGGVDKFRIKIWDKNDGDAVAYDNQMGDADGTDATHEIGGGSIVIHGDRSAAPAFTRVAGFELAQNYPNPFNPETWIPYQLAGDVDVIIRICDVTGKLISTLDLGHKPAGAYITKDKAAYWDGKNEAGERVASGIYFYSVQAGGFTATEKMIIAQ